MSRNVICMRPERHSKDGRRGDGIPDFSEGNALMTYQVTTLIS